MWSSPASGCHRTPTTNGLSGPRDPRRPVLGPRDLAQTVADPTQRLVVMRLDRASHLTDPRRRVDLHRVLRELTDDLPVLLVADNVGEVLDDVTAASDVQHLKAATDREHGRYRSSAAVRSARSPWSRSGRAHGRRMGVGAVLLRLQVVAAGEDQPVERVEQLLDAVLVGRHEHRAPAGPLDRAHVVVRDERRLALPVPPRRGSTYVVIPISGFRAIRKVEPRSPTLSPVQRLTRKQARRIAVRAQLLDAPRPTRSARGRRAADVPAGRPDRGDRAERRPRRLEPPRPAYRPEHLRAALEQDRTLFEFNALVRPMSDLGLYLADDGALAGRGRQREWLRDNDRFRRDILDRLRELRPAHVRDIPDTSVVPWPSTGWTNNRNVTQMLESSCCAARSRSPAASGASGSGTCAERVYPADVARSSVDEAERIRNERGCASLGIARAKAGRCRWSRSTSARPASRRRRGRARASGASTRRTWTTTSGPHRAAVAVRPARPRPRARRGAVRVRVHARDVQAGREAPLGLLRAADPPRRPARREARRRRPTARPRCSA